MKAEPEDGMDSALTTFKQIKGEVTSKGILIWSHSQKAEKELFLKFSTLRKKMEEQRVFRVFTDGTKLKTTVKAKKFSKNSP